MLRLIKETPAWLCYGVCLNLQSWKRVTSRIIPRTHSSSVLVLPIIILSLVFEDDPCGIVAVPPPRAARTLRVDEDPSHMSPRSGRRLPRRGSLPHWSTCWQSSLLCTFTEWTASTFPPREQVQIVTIQVFMSFCFFSGSFHTVHSANISWCLNTFMVVYNPVNLCPGTEGYFKNHVQRPRDGKMWLWGGSLVHLRKSRKACVWSRTECWQGQKYPHGPSSYWPLPSFWEPTESSGDFSF